VQIAQPFIVEVQICSANGNVVKDAKAPVTLKCFKEDGTPVNLTGNCKVSASAGVAKFYGMAVMEAPEGLLLTATSPGLAPSPGVPLTGGDAVDFCPMKLVASALHIGAPLTGNEKVGQPIVFEVKIVDDEGNLVSDAEPVIMLQLARGKGNLGGTLKATAVNGVARFEDVTYDRRDPFTVTAVSDGLKPSTFPEAITLKPKDDFVVTDAGSVADEDAEEEEEAEPMVVSVVPLESAVQRGKPFAVDVELRDKEGNLLTDATPTVTVKAVKPDGTLVELFGKTKAKVEDGRAHFEGLTLQTLLLDDVFLVATGSGLESGRGVPVLGGPPPLLPEERVPAQLEIKAPREIELGSKMQVEVKVLDENGNLCVAADCPVQLEIAGGNGDLTGTISATAKDGVATFPEVQYTGNQPFGLMAHSANLSSGASEHLIEVRPTSRLNLDALKDEDKEDAKDSPGYTTDNPDTVRIETELSTPLSPILSKLSPDELDGFRRKFKAIDIDGDGFIMRHEVDRLYRTIFVELTEKELDDIFGEWDLDGNGLVSFEDFVKSQQIRRAVKVRELGRRGEMERRKQMPDPELQTDEFNFKPGLPLAKQFLIDGDSVKDYSVSASQAPSVVDEGSQHPTTPDRDDLITDEDMPIPDGDAPDREIQSVAEGKFLKDF
jgi:hypothetical protein